MGGHWGSLPPNVLPLPLPLPHRSFPLRHVARGDTSVTSLCPTPSPAHGKDPGAKIQPWAELHPPSLPIPSLGTAPQELPHPWDAASLPCVFLGFSFTAPLQSRNAGSFPNSAVLLGWINPRIVPGQWVLTNAAHPAHQAGAEPPPLPGQNPPLHRPRAGSRQSGEGSSRQHLLLAKLDPGGCGRMSSGPQLLPPSHFLTPGAPGAGSARSSSAASPTPAPPGALPNPHQHHSSLETRREGRSQGGTARKSRRAEPLFPPDPQGCSDAGSGCGHSRALPAPPALGLFFLVLFSS